MKAAAKGERVIVLHELEHEGGKQQYVFDLDAAWVREHIDLPDWKAHELPSEPLSEPLPEPRSGLADEPAGQLTITAQIVNEDELWLDGEARLTLTTECGRCCAPLEVEVDAKIRAHVSSLSEADVEERELTPEDLEREHFDGVAYSLDPLVREALMLEIPIHIRCEPECALELDESQAAPSPLAALLTLKDQAPKKEKN